MSFLFLVPYFPSVDSLVWCLKVIPSCSSRLLQLPLISRSPQGLLPSFPISSASMFSSVAGSGNHLCKCPVAGSVEGRLRGKSSAASRQAEPPLMVSRHSGL